MITEPVLFGYSPDAGDTPNTNDKGDGEAQSTHDAREASNNDSIAATSADYGGGENESGVGDCSVMSTDSSNSSSTGGAA